MSMFNSSPPPRRRMPRSHTVVLAAAMTGVLALVVWVAFNPHGRPPEKEAAPVEKVEVTTPAASPEPGESFTDEDGAEIYPVAVRAEADFLLSSDADLNRQGQWICGEFDEGRGALDVISGLLIEFDEGQAAVLLGAAPGAFCPEHESKIDALTGTTP